MLVSKKVIAGSVIVQLLLGSVASAAAPVTETLPPPAQQVEEAQFELPAEPQPEPAEPVGLLGEIKEEVSYPELMRRFDAGDYSIAPKIEKLIQDEEARLDELNVAPTRKGPYLERLQKQADEIKVKVKEAEGKVYGPPHPSVQKVETLKPLKIEVPEKPASFKFDTTEVEVEKLNLSPAPRTASQRVRSFVASLFNIRSAGALDETIFPVLEDARADDQEVIIDETIRDLALELHNNPVEIMNYVRNHIAYEPYYGAKKGSVGCLSEGLCNDVDASSLTIALLRAAGIPARYKKSVAVFNVEQLQNLLGVDRTSSVYAALYWNKVPVFVVSGLDLGPDPSIDTIDLSGETQLGLEWVFVEAFYDYDERGGKINNTLFFDGVQSTNELRSLLEPYGKKQWIPLDPTLKEYGRTQRDVLVETSNFNVENFWNNFFSYQGSLSPLDKFIQDLEQASGRSVADNTSSRDTLIQNYTVLPATLPYGLASGGNDEVQIDTEVFSVLPNERRQQVKFSLKRKDNSQIVFSKTFYASEADNVDFDLKYEGATPQDAQLIADQGGIASTPVELVQIKPYLVSATQRFAGIEGGNAPAVRIGDDLIMGFELFVKGESVYGDEKFSTAGNHEGIVIVFSRVEDRPYLADNSDTLIAGNAAIARAYLMDVQNKGEKLSGIFDIGYNFHFLRAVVTQTRDLREVDGTPTTFDFGGLSLDATSYIVSYSHRGPHQAHRKDFHLVWGLQSSYEEAQIFNDLGGLTGISTVKGLQYASGRPNEYTIHTITSQNEGVIDSLNLPANVRQNMHADVQQGRTITTPNTAVQQGAWRGVLYISLEADGAGTYAIGEQVQNGGWTGDMVTLNEQAVPEDGVILASYQVASADSTFLYYQDHFSNSSTLCGNVSQQTKNSILAIRDADLNATGEKVAGQPCQMKTVNGIGGKSRSYVLTTNGVKFADTAGDYAGSGYWVPIDYTNTAWQPVSWKIDQYISAKKNLAQGSLNRIADGEQYSLTFSTILGTFIQSICEKDGLFTCGTYATVYYVPYNQGGQRGQIYRVRGNMLSELASDNNAVVKKLGLPTMDEAYAAKSAEVTTGGNNDASRVYQSFDNGQLYKYLLSYAGPVVYYTFGGITDEHNELRNGQRGTNTTLGFPKEDPRLSNDGVTYHQLFEQDQEITWNTQTGATAVIEFYKYNCDVYSNIQNSLYLDAIAVQGVVDTGVQTLDDLAGLVVTVGGKLLHPNQTYNEIKEIADEIAGLDWDEFTEILSSFGSAAYNNIVQELNNASCPARQHYLGGRVVGQVLLIFVPASKLKMAAKIRILKRVELAIPGLAKLENVSKFVRKLRLVSEADLEAWRVAKLPGTSNEKGRAGEEFWKALTHTETPDGDETPWGLRKIDAYDPINGYAYEVKNYGTGKASLTTRIREEIDKDIYLMNSKKNYRPVWVFIDQGPTSALADELAASGIETILLK
ncbi:hypothetical protein CO046_03860 [Candidatus Peregrinibacteria bacterium CG_4_9_14_0_2_um_filter_53_11]|nr:MAG: hypothetical protein CO046_03860 [Candidatus Peregrinibacteria bacterium CG_4_9_14_0_2_um_filter_53_11]